MSNFVFQDQGGVTTTIYAISYYVDIISTILPDKNLINIWKYHCRIRDPLDLTDTFIENVKMSLKNHLSDFHPNVYCVATGETRHLKRWENPLELYLQEKWSCTIHF